MPQQREYLRSCRGQRVGRAVALAALVWCGMQAVSSAQWGVAQWDEMAIPTVSGGVDSGQRAVDSEEGNPSLALRAGEEAVGAGQWDWGAVQSSKFKVPDPCSPSSDPCLLSPISGCEYWYHWGGKARAYYVNDQRIEWTGQEATFTTEGVVDGGIHQQVGAWECMVLGEVFLNLPFDRNILQDTPERASFARNFDIDPFQISQLQLAARKENLYFAAGRFVTPFGRFYFPLFRNQFDDSPFIRSEAILFRETGFLAQWDPEGWVFTAALTNGGFGQDTNSSKAGIARVGIDREAFALGASIKVQDGIGSERQKMFNGHVGLDGMVRRGGWTLSGEVIWDEYGFRDTGFDPNDIFWGRSSYLRDANLVDQEPLTGVGYYVNLSYDAERWSALVNYGDYFPQQTLGIAAHDEAIHRGLIKGSYRFTPNLEAYGVGIAENTVDFPFGGRVRKGSSLIFGCQFTL